MINSIVKAKPFLKWAGGKTQLLPEIREHLPNELKLGRVKYYVEPFVGSGAVLFDLLQNDEYGIQKAFIWDINPELINVYKVIKSENVKFLIEDLKRKEEEYLLADEPLRKEIYMSVRSKFNEELEEFEANPTEEFLVKRASEFIFLNRTCFNGLFRVNKKGQFNVPMGRYKNPKICDEENLQAVHHLLEKVEIAEPGDYKQSYATIEYIISSEEQVFVYFDPPYRPITESSSFTSYSKYDFNDDNQRELADYFKQLDKLGAYVMLSNSDPKNVKPDDKFFDELYFKPDENNNNLYNLNRVYARRNINSKGDKRGEITELLITNY